MDEYLSKYHLFNLEWLSIPAIYALLIWIIQRFFEYEVTFFYTTYALLMGIWSQMFLRSWDRKCSELTIEWDNFTTEYDKENVRSDFVGEIRSCALWSEMSVPKISTKEQILNQRNIVGNLVPVALDLVPKLPLGSRSSARKDSVPRIHG